MNGTSRRDLFLVTFSILSLELAVIRWMSQQVTLFAYLGSVLLIGAFLGMGLGVALGRRRPQLFGLTLPALALLSAVLAYSEKLHILHTRFPGRAVAMWGMEGAKSFASSLAVIVALFAAVVGVFLLAGTRVGEIFASSDALDAYSIDLAGSFAGVVAMAIVSSAQTPPPIWFAIGGVPLAWVSRRWSSWVALGALLVFTTLSIRGAIFSPYYRIDLDRASDVAGAPIRLSVNRDFHQYVHDFSSRHLNDPALSESVRAVLRSAELTYRLPFALVPRHDNALIVGAGTGNDVAAALRQGFGNVVSVDIDPRIIEIGRTLHPERPYSDPRTVPVVNDARAYFESTNQQFDVVDFGLLDSHAVFSAMSSLRLDNYVYTVESMRSAWRHVRTPGLMSVSFSIGDREWLSDRLYKIVRDATGVDPIVLPHQIQHGRFYIVTKGIEPRELAVRARLRTLPSPDTSRVEAATDDWPFLYLNPGEIPVGYIAMIAAILVIAVLGTRAAFGPGMFRGHSFDPLLFVMGAAFLLIETRSVTDLSLLFGSTWVVNAAVFAGVLAVVFAANALVRAGRRPAISLIFGLLFASLLLNYVVRPDELLRLPFVVRSILGPLLAALPVGFAGIIFSSVFAESSEPNASLGSNLLGAVVGGCLEFLSMATGLRALTLLALTFYLVALLLYRRSHATVAAT
jgi:Spermine/spermidine synthase domain